MKPIVRNLLIAGTLTIVGFSLIASQKVDKLLAIFNKMSMRPASLPKNIQLSNPNNLGIPQDVSFDIDMKITNPDFEAFEASGYGVATLKSVDIYFKKEHIGTADLNLEDITIPAQSTYILPGLKVKGKTLSLLSNLSAFQNMSLADLQFVATIEVLGIDYEIGS